METLLSRNTSASVWCMLWSSSPGVNYAALRDKIFHKTYHSDDSNGDIDTSSSSELGDSEGNPSHQNNSYKHGTIAHHNVAPPAAEIMWNCEEEEEFKGEVAEQGDFDVPMHQDFEAWDCADKEDWPASNTDGSKVQNSAARVDPEVHTTSEGHREGWCTLCEQWMGLG